MRPLPTSLNLLRTFDVAARHLSFTLAAQELCITPSAVSQQIRSLEEQLGIDLFDRQPRALQLTEPGQRYWQDIRQHLQGIEDSTRRLVSPSRDTRPLKVSLMPPMASRVVLPNLANFRQAFPAVSLHLDASLRPVDLAAGEADLAIRFGQPPWPGCQHEKLLDLYVLPVCPPQMAREHDLAHHPERLADMPLINMSSRPDAWQRYFAMAGLAAPESAQAYVVDDYPAAVEAAETLGVALAVLPLEQPLLDSARLAAPWPAAGPLTDAVYAVIRDDAQQREDVTLFLTWLKDQLALLPTPNA